MGKSFNEFITNGKYISDNKGLSHKSKIISFAKIALDYANKRELTLEQIENIQISIPTEATARLPKGEVFHVDFENRRNMAKDAAQTAEKNKVLLNTKVA